MIEAIDDLHFGGKRQEVLERDNFECQDCGMSQEKHFVLFNRSLVIHHKDGKGTGFKRGYKNNETDNLITLCIRCHCKIHLHQRKEEKYGDLLDQDKSEWKYPKIRELIDKQIKNGFGIQESKRIVAKNTGIGFSSIDHNYYELKSKTAYD